MKIVHVTSVHRWNDVRIYHKMCLSLAAEGHQVHLVAPAPGPGVPQPGDTRGVEIHFIPRRPGRLGRVLGTAHEAARHGFRLDGDILHFHDPELLPYLALGGRGYNTRVVYDVHEDHRVSVVDRSWAPPAVRPLLGWSVGAMEDLFSSRFAAIVAATPRIASRFTGHARVALVQNFPEIESGPSAELADSRIPGRFTYIGGLSEGRCVEEMIDSIDLAGDPAALELAGPWEKAALAESCQARPGWRRVVEHGFLARPEVFRLMRTAVAGLVLFRPLRNHVEAQPNKLFEYMLAGLPVIASDFPLWRELIEPANLGLLVDPESPAAIAAAMRWIMAHPAEAAEMGRRGQAAVRQRYNWRGEFAKLLQLYDAVNSTS